MSESNGSGNHTARQTLGLDVLIVELAHRWRTHQTARVIPPRAAGFTGTPPEHECC
jgi:hypothetical protein